MRLMAARGLCGSLKNNFVENARKFKKIIMIIVYITYPSKKHARNTANLLLKKRLIACANIFPMESMYWWKGKVAEEKEWAVLLKTEEKNYARIQKKVREAHPYAVSCILKLNVEANKEYEKWVKENVGVRGAYHAKR